MSEKLLADGLPWSGIRKASVFFLILPMSSIDSKKNGLPRCQGESRERAFYRDATFSDVSLLHADNPTEASFARRPETLFLSVAAPMESHWRARVDATRSLSTVRGVSSRHVRLPDRVLLASENEGRDLVALPVDGENLAILAPADPVAMMLRHRQEVDRLRTALGSAQLFEKHVFPLLFAWAALVQSLPREARGLWSGADGFFEAGLQFARGALNAADARVLEPTFTPTKRTRWTDRMRVAVVAAGLLSDADRLAGLRLQAGGLKRATSVFEVTETWSPGEETALSFGVRNAGRWFRLLRMAPGETADRLPTLGLDLLRLMLPAPTQIWLSNFERAGGETVFTALKVAVMFRTGRTESEKLIAESVARGREWAVNRRAYLAAQREGKSPLLQGFAEVFRVALLTRVAERLWCFNSEQSPLVWAADGLFMRWPEGFVETVETAGEGSVFREIPDEPEVAARILATAGVILSDTSGAHIFLSPDLGKRADTGPLSSLAEPGRQSWVKLANEDMIVNLARRIAMERGETMAERLSYCIEEPRERGRGKRWPLSEGRFAWALDLPPLSSRVKGLRGQSVRPALFRALERINLRRDAPLFGSVLGLFVPERLLDESFRPDAEELRSVLVPVEQSPGSAVPSARVSFYHRLRLTGRDAERLADLSPEGKPDRDGRLLLEGILINPHCVRPIEVWEDGTEEERRFPDTVGRHEWVDGSRYVGRDAWRKKD